MEHLLTALVERNADAERNRQAIDLMMSLGIPHVFIAGLTNDYLGYFLSPASYRRQSYIACGSLYGERGGEIVRDAALAALRRLAPLKGTR